MLFSNKWIPSLIIVITIFFTFCNATKISRLKLNAQINYPQNGHLHSEDNDDAHSEDDSSGNNGKNRNENENDDNGDDLYDELTTPGTTNVTEDGENDELSTTGM